MRDRLAISWVIYRGPRSTSLAPLPLLDDKSKLSLFEWCADRLSRSLCTSAVRVIHTASDGETVRQDPKSTSTLEVSDPHITKALLRAMSELGLDNVMLASIETGLLPTRMLNTFLSAHQGRGAAITRAAGLPRGIELYGFSHTYLIALHDWFGANLPFHPGRGLEVQAFTKRSREAGEDEEPMLFQDVMLNPEPSIVWPKVVDLSTPAGVARLRASLQAQKSDDLLATWYAEEQSEKQALFRNLQGYSRGSRAVASRRKNVLIVSNACGYSGAEGSLVELVRKIDPARYNVTTLLSMDGHLAKSLRPHVERCIIYGDDFTQYTTSTMLRLRTLLKELEPDIAHFNSFEGMPLVYLCVALGIPYLQHIRNGDLRGFDQAIESADAVIAVSRYLAAKVTAIGPASDCLRVIYDEVDTTHFSRERMSQQRERLALGVPLDSFTILCIARFVPNKRHDVLVAALTRLAKRVPLLRVLLKGDSYGPDSSYSKVLSLLESSGLAEIAHHIRFMRDLRPLYTASDVLVLCSDDEGLGRCVVEAMSMALPVVVTDTGGTHEIIEHDKTGVVIPGGNPVALEEALYRIYSDPHEAAVMGAAGRRFAQDHLSADQSATEIMALYDQVLERDSRE